MEKIISFIVDNWKPLACVVCVCIELVVFLLKKKPVKVVDSIYQELTKLVLQAVRIVEKPGNGDFKKTEVLKMVQDWLADKHPEIDFSIYLDFASKLIEDILSTPQKKGD